MYLLCTLGINDNYFLNVTQQKLHKLMVTDVQFLMVHTAYEFHNIFCVCYLHCEWKQLLQMNFFMGYYEWHQNSYIITICSNSKSVTFWKWDILAFNMWAVWAAEYREPSVVVLLFCQKCYIKCANGTKEIASLPNL